MLVGWLLRLLLLALVIRAVWRLVRGVLQGLQAGQAASAQVRGGARSKPSVPLVRDPVCGTYVVRDRAIALHSGASTQYFCSERCRDAYLRTQANERPA